jgi:hypothetical protein
VYLFSLIDRTPSFRLELTQIERYYHYHSFCSCLLPATVIAIATTLQLLLLSQIGATPSYHHYRYHIYHIATTMPQLLLLAATPAQAIDIATPTFIASSTTALSRSVAATTDHSSYSYFATSTITTATNTKVLMLPIPLLLLALSTCS